MLPADVIVIGAGIAGLSVAYELQTRGVRASVLERASRPGGVILSESIEGLTIDAGPDSLLVQKPEGIRLCQELGLADSLIPTTPPRIAYIQRGGRLHALPAASVLGIPTRIGPFVTTRLFSLTGKLRMAGELMVPPRREETDESIAAFMTRRFGAEATMYLAEPLLAGIHAGDVDRLSVRSLFPQLVETERTDGSLLRGFRRRRRPVGGDGAFRSLPGGMTGLVNALIAAMPAETVQLNTAATRVTTGGESLTYRVETVHGASIEARAIVFAAPAFVTGALLRDFDDGLARMCGDVPYASTATVVLAFRRSAVRHPLEGSGFVVPRVENTGILAASWLSSKWAHRAPPDIALMRTFVGGARDPDALNRPDDELRQMSLDALSLLLGISEPPLMTRVYRWERASAQHEVGHAARMAAIDQSLKRHPGMFVTGSGFRGVGIPDCIADGRITGKQVAEWLAQSVS